MTDALERWNKLEEAAKGLQPKLQESPDGNYLIPGLSMATANSEQLYELDTLVYMLREIYPDYTFWKSETLFDNEGLKINWKYTKGMSPTQAIHSIRKTKMEESIAIEREQELKEIEDEKELKPESTDIVSPDERTY